MIGRSLIAVSAGALSACALLTDVDSLSAGEPDDAGVESEADSGTTGADGADVEDEGTARPDGAERPDGSDASVDASSDGPCPAPVTVRRFPAAAVNASGDGRSWSEPENVIASDGDGARVTLLTGAFDELSRPLLASNFGFSIPEAATIRGVTVYVRRKASRTDVEDGAVRLAVGGTAVGVDLGTKDWTTDYLTVSYGGDVALWGLPLTPAIVNAIDFGVTLGVLNQSPTNATAEIDVLNVDVTYCPAP